MTNLAQWSALVGFLLPIAIAVIQQARWSSAVRTVIGAICCVAAAIVTALVEAKLTFENWATSIIFVAVTAWTSYRNVWVPLGTAPWVERKTS